MRFGLRACSSTATKRHPRRNSTPVLQRADRHCANTALLFIAATFVRDAMVKGKHPGACSGKPLQRDAFAGAFRLQRLQILHKMCLLPVRQSELEQRIVVIDDGEEIGRAAIVEIRCVLL